MAIAAAPMAKKVIHNNVLDNQPFLYFPMIFSLLAILTMRNNNGTAATPFKTADYTNALTDRCR